MTQPSDQGDSFIDGKFSNNFANVSVNDDSRKYKMNHQRRGHFIIINNKKFDPSTGMSERSGTDVDAANLYTLFSSLGFQVQLFHNLRAQDMMDKVFEVSRYNHNDCDCYGMAILSHGEQGLVFGTDQVIEIERLIAPIKSCLSLGGKPKLLFLQACRGTQLDDGVDVFSDAEAEPARPSARIPIEADFLYAYSTTPGYFSWRNSSKGSWFVQALCKVFNEVANRRIEICQILTRVNYAVAYEFESNAAQPHMNKKKQVPSIVSMLTKELYFWNN